MDASSKKILIFSLGLVLLFFYLDKKLDSTVDSFKKPLEEMISRQVSDMFAAKCRASVQELKVSKLSRLIVSGASVECNGQTFSVDQVSLSVRLIALLKDGASPLSGRVRAYGVSHPITGTLATESLIDADAYHLRELALKLNATDISPLAKLYGGKRSILGIRPESFKGEMKGVVYLKMKGDSPHFESNLQFSDVNFLSYIQRKERSFSFSSVEANISYDKKFATIKPIVFTVSDTKRLYLETQGNKRWTLYHAGASREWIGIALGLGCSQKIVYQMVKRPRSKLRLFEQGGGGFRCLVI